MDKQVFIENMAGMAEYFDKELTKPISSVYWQSLRHLDNNVFIDIVTKLVKKSKWFPRVNEMLELAPEPLALDNKGSLSWCDNTQWLVEQYGEIKQ